MTSVDLDLRIARKRMLTREVCEIELRLPDGGVLPACTAGAHLNVRTPSGPVRSYSLTQDEADTGRYVIAVKRLAQGRGGSRSMVDDTVEGMSLKVTGVSNAFPIVEASRYLFIGGGIGITPLMGMMRSLLRRHDAEFDAVYCARAPRETAYLEELAAMPFRDRVRLHHTHGQSGRRFDFWPLLRHPREMHVYCCGPQPLMEEVRALTIHWPPRLVHFESFLGVSGVTGTDSPFRVKRASTCEVFEIPADQTILNVLDARGILLPSTCGSGTCGTCKTRWIRGEVDHRDLVLSEAERREFMMPCVSRAAGEEIELDF